MNYGKFFYEKATFLFLGEGRVIRRATVGHIGTGVKKCQKQGYVVYGRSLSTNRVQLLRITFEPLRVLGRGEGVDDMDPKRK